jgi:hypothetical protein
MFNLIKNYRREFVYSCYLFLVFELLLTPSFIINRLMFWGTVSVGLLLMISWLLHTYHLFAKRKVSKSSDVLMKVNLRDRIFTHILLPVLSYTSIVSFFFFSRNLYLNQIVVVISVLLFFYLFLHIRTSYEKVFYIEKHTRIIYDFITISTFYLFTSTVAHLALPAVVAICVVAFLAFVAFVYMLYLNNKLELDGALVAILATVIVSLVTIYIWDSGVFTAPAVIATVFYTVVSLWHVRFSGSRSMDDYIPPVMYTLMTLILVLSL